MKLLAKLSFGTLAAVLLISGIAVLSPRAVHAVVATIIRDQDNPARHPFVEICTGPTTNSNAAARCSTNDLPAGQEFVIETVSISATGDPSNIVLAPTVFTTAGGRENVSYALNPISNNGLDQQVASQFTGTQLVRFYADPGTAITCEGVTPNVNVRVHFFFVCTFSGYFVTLP
jgi:hypothetical protein